MTTDEAKKAGFRTDANGWATTWRILNTSEIRRLNSKVRGLDANDFPTRAKAREALRKRKMEEAKPSETPAEKDARIKALVDSYVDKGGPITKEQLTDEVSLWMSEHHLRVYYVRSDGVSCCEWTGNSASHHIALREGKLYWTRADAEHAKWLADMQSQTTPITPEQAKILRPDDVIFMYDIASLGVSGIRGDTAINDNSYVTSPLFFTEQAARDRLNVVVAAQATLDKAKWEPETIQSLDDFPINKEEPTYSTEMHNTTEDITLQTSLVLNHERGKTPSKLISFSNYKGIIPDRFTLDMKNFDLPALQGLINKAFVPVFRGQPKEVVTGERQPTILEEAAKCVTGPRRRDYGTPEENFSLIAKLWSLQLHHEVTPMQVALCLVLLKVARQANSPKRDNLVDIAGYAQCASELTEQRKS